MLGFAGRVGVSLGRGRGGKSAGVGGGLTSAAPTVTAASLPIAIPLSTT